MKTLKSWMLNVGSPTEVRRIPINSVSLTGEVLGHEFESSLERDLIQICCWSNQLSWFKVQPVTISYEGDNGKQRKYTPDLLIAYASHEDPCLPQRKPMLCEVKYREDLARNWKELKPKFKAAKRYAKEQGWEFKIFTEDRIRTTYLTNVQTLWTYRFAPWHEHCFDPLLYGLLDVDECTVSQLLDSSFDPSDVTLRAEALWTVWGMIARGIICCDMNELVTINSKIWVQPSLRSDFALPEDDD